MKKYISYIISIILTIVMLIALYKETTAFNNTIFISDSYSQYYPLFEHFKNILGHTSSLFYSFSGGLGFNFLNVFFYYLASPFNLLIILFKQTEDFMLTITLIKFILIPIFTIKFFRYHFKDNIVYEIIFSLAYTLCGYNIAYFFNIMWLDGVFMLPLLLLGIDKMLKQNKNKLYICSLIYIIITNYYIGFMSCIFSFLYFNYSLFLKYSIKYDKKQIIKSEIAFIIKNILIVLTTAFVLFSVIKYLPGYARSGEQIFQTPIIFNFNLSEFFQNFFVYSTSNMDFLNENGFHLYSGLLNFMLFILFVLNPETTMKEKVLTISFFTILYLSVVCNYINYAWTLFSKPQFLNGRFTYMYSLFLCFIGYKSMLRNPKNSLITYIILPIIVVIASINWKGTLFTLQINIVLIIIYLLILYAQKYKKNSVTNYVLLLLCIFELFINATESLQKLSFKQYSEIMNNYNIYKAGTLYIKNQDKSFYRVDIENSDMYNSPLLYHYNGIDIFLSQLKDSTANFFWNIGYGSGATKKNTIEYHSGTQIIDSLLANKYIISATDQLPDYELLTSNIIDHNSETNKYNIYKNPTALSLGYMVNDSIKDISIGYNALILQNNILKSMSNLNDDIYIPIELHSNNNSYYFKNDQNLPIVIYNAINSNNGYNNYSIKIDNEIIPKGNDFEIIMIDNKFGNRDISISISGITPKRLLGTFASYYNKDAFNRIINNLQQNELIIDDYSDNNIKGHINVTNDKTVLFTSISYDSNWYVYVDGRQVKTIKLLNELLGAELTQGNHEIELKYIPKELYIGITISIIASLSLYLYINIYKKRTK